MGWIAEQLERRMLLAAVSWTGNGGDSNWENPANWSDNAVPGLDDDVTVAGAITSPILLSSVSQDIKSLVTDNDLRLSNATLTVTNNVTLLNGAALTLSQSGGFASFLNFQDGNQVLGGDGQVVFDGTNATQPSFLRPTATVSNIPVTLTIAPGVTIRTGTGNGVIGSGPSNASVVNHGTISAQTAGRYLRLPDANYDGSGGQISVSDGTLDLAGSFTQPKLGTVTHTGGTINISGTLSGGLSLNATTGSWNLNGGTLAGGVYSASGGASLAVILPSYLDGMTLASNLTLLNQNLVIHNGLTLSNGAVLTLSQSGGSISTLQFQDGNQVLGGDGQVVFDGTSATQPSYITLAGPASPPVTLTIGSGVTIRTGTGSGVLAGGPSNSAIVNQGMISAQTIDRSINIQCDFTNTGIIRVNGTLISMAALSENGSAILTGAALSVVTMAGDFLGNSSSKSGLPGSLTLNGAGSSINPQYFEAMSQDLGAAPAGFSGNSAFGSITLGNGNYLRLVDQADNAPGTDNEAVYVNSISVPSGATLDLNGLHVYARVAQIAGAVVGGTITEVPDGGPLLLAVPTAGNVSSIGEVDEWQFFGRSGHGITVSINPGSASPPSPLAPTLGWVAAQIIGPDGQPIASADNTSGGSGSILELPGIALPEDGTYTVTVSFAQGHNLATGHYIISAYDSTVNTRPLTFGQQETSSIVSAFTYDRWTVQTPFLSQPGIRVSRPNSHLF